MKRIIALIGLLLFTAVSARAQQPLPNISYNALLNSTCSTPNTACSGAVFVTSGSGIGNGPNGSGSALDIPVSNYSAVTVTVSGTYTGSTIGFDFSDPTGGTNYFQEVCARTDINLLEVSEVLPSNQVRAWQCPVWASTRFRVRQSAYASGAVNVWITLTVAAIDPSLVVAASVTNVAGASDPCQDVSAIKSSVVVAQASATTTQLVALSAGKIVYVCGLSMTIAPSGTSADTATFEYGTGASCGTGTTALTGAFGAGDLTTAAPPLFVTLGAPGTAFSTAAGNALCIVSAGTTVSIQGVLSYVQQ